MEGVMVIEIGSLCWEMEGLFCHVGEERRTGFDIGNGREEASLGGKKGKKSLEMKDSWVGRWRTEGFITISILEKSN